MEAEVEEGPRREHSPLPQMPMEADRPGREHSPPLVEDQPEPRI